MATKEIKETLSFNENEIKQAILDFYYNEPEPYDEWEIKIDNGKTPTMIILTKHKTETIE